MLPGHGALAGDAVAAVRACPGVDLDRVGHAPHGARPGDEGLGVGGGVQDERAAGVEDAVGTGTQPGVALRGDHDGRPEGAEALEEVGGVGGGLQGGELVDDEQHRLVWGLAGRGVVGEVLQEEAPQPGGLLLEGQAL